MFRGRGVSGGEGLLIFLKFYMFRGRGVLGGRGVGGVIFKNRKYLEN